MEDQLLTTKDVALKLQVQERTVRRWLRNGQLRGIHMDRDWRVRSEELERFLKERERGA